MNVFFLAVFIVSLGILLLSSRVIRAIAWDTLRHPFTKATIIVNEDRVEVRHHSPTDNSSTLTSSSSR